MRIRWRVRWSPHKWFPDGSLPALWWHMGYFRQHLHRDWWVIRQGPKQFPSHCSMMFLHWIFGGPRPGLLCILLADVMLLWLHLGQMQTLEGQFCSHCLSRLWAPAPSVPASESPEWNTHLQPLKKEKMVIYLYYLTVVQNFGADM